MTTRLHARLPLLKMPQHRLFNPSTVQALIKCKMRDIAGGWGDKNNLPLSDSDVFRHNKALAGKF